MSDGYEPPSLAPLLITPAITAAARANQAGGGTHSPSAPPPPLPAASDVEQLAAMFPDYDGEVLGSVLAAAGNMEEAVVQLLEMGGTETMATDEAQLMARLQAEQAETDEMCALRLFRQFADELGGQLGERVPPEILNDPVRYEAFVRQRFEQELLREGSQLSRRAESLWAPSGGGSGGGSDEATTSDGSLPRKQGLLERMKRMPLFASRVGVEDGAKPLLLSDQAKEG